MPRGRPTSLTPQIIEDFVLCFPRCMFVSTTADFLGVPKTTFYRWLRRGRDRGDGIYREFWHAYKKGMAEAQMLAISVIRKAARQHWQAAAWLLERRWPGKWGRNRQALRALQQTLHGLQERVRAAGPK